MVDFKQLHKKVEQFTEQELDKANWKKVAVVWSLYFLAGFISSLYTYVLDGRNLEKIEYLKYKQDMPLYFFDSFMGFLPFLLIFLFSIPILCFLLDKLFKKKVTVATVAYAIGIGFVLLIPMLLVQKIVSGILFFGLFFSIIAGLGLLYLNLVLLKSAFRINYGKTFLLYLLAINISALAFFLLFIGYALVNISLQQSTNDVYTVQMLNHTDGAFTIKFNYTVADIKSEICEINFPPGWELAKHINASSDITYKEFIKTATKNTPQQESIFFDRITGGVTECSKGFISGVLEPWKILFEEKGSRACGIKKYNTTTKVVLYAIDYDNLIEGSGYSAEYISTIDDEDFFFIINNTSCHTQWHDNSLLAKVFFR